MSMPALRRRGDGGQTGNGRGASAAAMQSRSFSVSYHEELRGSSEDDEQGVDPEMVDEVKKEPGFNRCG